MNNMINLIKMFLLGINIFLIIVFLFMIGFFLILSEILKKSFFEISDEVLRKIPHVFIGLIFASTPYFLSKNEILLFSIILFFGVIFNKYMHIFKAVFLIKRRSFGILLTPISLIISALIFLPENKIAFSVGFTTLALADSLAALVGKKSKRFIFSTKKTIDGTFVFFVITFFIFLISSFYNDSISFFKIIFSSIILTLIEFFFIFGLDNIFIPIVSSYLFVLFF